MDLSHGKFMFKDYRGLDLRTVPMSYSTFVGCKFDGADMTDVDASHSVFVGGAMRKTKCTRTNFMNSQLNIRFEPSDCLGMTLTLSCSTFKGMTISKMWWYGWLYFTAAQMMPAIAEGEANPQDGLKSLIGFELYARLDKLFRERQL